MHDEEDMIPTLDEEESIDQIENYTLQTTSARSSLLRRAPFIIGMTVLYFVLRQLDHNFVFNPVNADIFLLLIIVAFVTSIFALSLVVQTKQEELHKKQLYRLFKRTNDVLDFLSVIPTLMVLFTLANMFFISFSPISGSSMEPNYHDNEAVIFTHFNVSYERYDVVILYVEEYQDPYLIKRIIGLPGETVLIDNNEVYIDGELLPQTFIDQDTVKTYCYNSDDIDTCEFTVTDNSYFVLGDNRDGKAVVGEISGYSRDSREFGVVPYEDLFGKVILSFKDYNLLN
ncbi:signal peptidase I [Candidatus Xianfuyuplasma coldseepsis]|uniref:Signal peptidase I n=1 Tax=Candidatus Xianfuyuplasma coldseepsis TaxID=2782163 RepID=A0A7L7KRQ5_9MOLU|nr:signal peptidase I [Xianfuyuplasma coldseepsis]QMS85413.1 signal peptidase I [Xianfuyuplasma coldseepsis]